MDMCLHQLKPVNTKKLIFCRAKVSSLPCLIAMKVTWITYIHIGKHKLHKLIIYSFTGEELWPIRIGSLNPKGNLPKLSMLAMQSLSGEDYYFICMENYFKGIKRTKQV